MVTDEKGMILEKENMDEFGNVGDVSSTSLKFGISRHGLSSNMLDTDTGLYYFATRWYDASKGRFLEMDPVLSEAGLMNMYEYCGNNPANVTDRYGEWIPALMAVGGIVMTLIALDKISEQIAGAKAKENYSEGEKTGTEEQKAAEEPEAQKLPGPFPEEIRGRKREVENKFRQEVKETLTEAGEDIAKIMNIRSGNYDVLDLYIENKEGLLTIAAGGGLYLGATYGGTMLGTIATWGGISAAFIYSGIVSYKISKSLDIYVEEWQSIK